MEMPWNFHGKSMEIPWKFHEKIPWENNENHELFPKQCLHLRGSYFYSANLSRCAGIRAVFRIQPATARFSLLGVRKRRTFPGIQFEVHNVFWHSPEPYLRHISIFVTSCDCTTKIAQQKYTAKIARERLHDKDCTTKIAQERLHNYQRFHNKGCTIKIA